MDTATRVFDKFKDGTLPWLELDMDFNPYVDDKELAKVDKHYVPHRENESHKGWSSCCLHGLGIDKTQVAKEYGYTVGNFVRRPIDGLVDYHVKNL